MNTEEPNEWVNAGTNNDGIDENELGPSEKKNENESVGDIFKWIGPHSFWF